MICQKCQRVVHDEAIICPTCGCATGVPIPKEALPDKANGVVAFFSFLLSFFFAEGVIFGFALWAAKTDIQPKAARTYGLCAILPWFLKWIIPAIIKAIVAVIVAILVVIAIIVFVALYFSGVLVF